MGKRITTYTDEEIEYLAQLIREDVEAVYSKEDFTDQFNARFAGTENDLGTRSERSPSALWKVAKENSVRPEYVAWKKRREERKAREAREAAEQAALIEAQRQAMEEAQAQQQQWDASMEEAQAELEFSPWPQ